MQQIFTRLRELLQLHLHTLISYRCFLYEHSSDFTFTRSHLTFLMFDTWTYLFPKDNLHRSIL
jgi:hypothetical protein